MTETPDFPMQPAHAFKQGKVADVPILYGTNEGDAILFVACGKKNVSRLEWHTMVDIAFAGEAKDIMKAYPDTRQDDDTMQDLNHVFTDFLFV